MTDFKKLLSAIAVCTVIAAVFITATVSVTARDEGSTQITANILSPTTQPYSTVPTVPVQDNTSMVTGTQTYLLIALLLCIALLAFVILLFCIHNKHMRWLWKYLIVFSAYCTENHKKRRKWEGSKCKIYLKNLKTEKQHNLKIRFKNREAV